MKVNNRESLLFSSPRPSNISIDLQMNLLNTWTKHKIPDNYQNLFLAYLDEQPVEIAETEMKKQIKQTIEKNTFFFKIQTMEDRRVSQLNSLEELLSNSNNPITSDELTTICEEVKSLRIINLQLAEALLKMYDSFKCYNNDSIQKQTQFFEPYLSRLNSQNKMIRQSILGKYINFGSGYDPFLMDYYEQFHRNNGSNIEASIKWLFQLNISFVYRLLKAKNALLEIKAKIKPEQVASKSIIYLKAPSKEINQVNKHRQRGYSLEQIRKPIKTESVPSRNDYPLEKINPIKIAPIQVFPSRTTIYSPQRLNSPSYTEGPSYDFMQSRVIQRKLDPIQNGISLKNQRRSNKVYLQTESSEYQTLYDSFQPNQSNKELIDSYRKDEYYAKPQIIKLKPYKLTPITYKPEGENQSAISHHPQSIIYSQQLASKELKQRIYNNSKQQRQESSIPQNYLQNKLKQFKTLAAVDYQVKNYNPIKKNQYELIKNSQKASKYDYVPITNAQLSQGDEEGLSIQTPIYKYNKKNPEYKKTATTPTNPSLINQLTLSKRISKNTPKIQGQSQRQSPPQRPKIQNHSKNGKQREKSAIQQNTANKKVNQQCQTIQSQQVIIQAVVEKQNNQTRSRRESQVSKQANIKSIKQQTSQNLPLSKSSAPTENKPEDKVPVYSKSDISNLDQTLQNEDIVDDRPAEKIYKNQPLIKSLPRETGTTQNTNNTNARPGPISNPVSPQYPEVSLSIIATSTKQAQKKEIKMKVGKSTFNQLLTLLQSSPISPQTKIVFSFDKLSQWLKIGQTYLIQFHVNNECAVIALCSPIPSIGMALKLWAPIHPSIDAAASSNLFLKYIEFIEKSTTVEKIMFSGNGEAFKELHAAEFIRKKENLYERARKMPPKKVSFEFKPFLYVECSSVTFNQPDNGTLLFSEEIQQFSPTNHYCSNILSDNTPSAIPKTLLPFIKISQDVKDFAEVNKILTAEQFDNYEAGQIKMSSINLLRLFANTPFKSSFIANDGYLQLVGILLHQKQKQCLISVPTSRHNGTIYFAKNMDVKYMIDKCKAPSGNNKVKFNIKMFHKALYGKLLNRSKGCYGNWEINLTWEDEMQGKVKHPLPQGRWFGPESFLVGIEIEKELLLCAEINKDDFIY